MFNGRRILAFLITVACVFGLAACGKEETQAEVPQTPVLPADSSDSVTVPQMEENLNVVTINTPFGDIYYQEQWSEHMVVTQQQNGEQLVVTFAAEFNGMQYPLFELMIGAEEEEAVAQLTASDGTIRGVNVNFLELGEYPELGDDELNQLYAMQEDINFVIDNIK